MRLATGRMREVDADHAGHDHVFTIQEVVRLRFHGSHSYQEISQITGLSVGNVGFILNAAMRNLRGKMERDEKDEKIIYLAKRAAS